MNAPLTQQSVYAWILRLIQLQGYEYSTRRTRATKVAYEPARRFALATGASNMLIFILLQYKPSEQGGVDFGCVFFSKHARRQPRFRYFPPQSVFRFNIYVL